MLKFSIVFTFYLVESIILWQYSEELFQAKHSAKKRLLALFLLSMASFLIGLPQNFLLNIIVFFVTTITFLYTQYQIKWSVALLHTAVLEGVMALSESIVYSIINIIAPHFYTNNEQLYTLFLFGILSKLLYFFVTFLLAHIWKNQKKANSQPDKTAIVLGLIPMVSSVIITIFMSLWETEYIPSRSGWVITINAFFLLVINFFVYGFYQYNQKRNIQLSETKMLLQKERDTEEYYQMLLQQHENQSIPIHDIKKHLQSIEMLNEQGEPDKINAYIRQLLLSSDLQEASHLSDHKLLNSILTRYQRQCMEKHISLITDIRSGTTEFIADNDLTSLFCNLLDNAVEAAEGIPGGFVEVTSAKRENTAFVVITITNSCRANPFDGQSDTPVTSKTDKNHHGFGIKSIRRTVNKYQGNLQMYYNQEALTFHSILTLKQKESV